jgi:GrpB-like predicted nucleotidyltransferase (UPF0157 family)
MLIKEYTKDWVEDFEKIKQKLETVLPTTTKIEHVGSTSVPNLAAKSIIDIDIIYFEHSTNDFEKIKKALIQVGYFHAGNQGIKDREVFKRVDEITKKEDEILDKIIHHLYVCSSESEELKRHLLFRDYLRKNITARIDYQNMKYNLAKKANQDKKIYAEIKEKEATHFINSIIELAKKNNKKL